MAAAVMDKDFKLVTPDHVVKASVGDDVTLPCLLSPETSAVAMEIRWFRGTHCIYLYKNGHVTVREDYEGRVSVNTQKLQRGDVSLRLREKREGEGGVYTCQVISGEHKEEGRVGVRSPFEEADDSDDEEADDSDDEEADDSDDEEAGALSYTTRAARAPPPPLEVLNLTPPTDINMDGLAQLTEMHVEEKMKAEMTRAEVRTARKMEEKREIEMEFVSNLKEAMKREITAEERKRMEESVQSLVGGESPGPTPPVSPAVSELRLVLLGGSTAVKREEERKLREKREELDKHMQESLKKRDGEIQQHEGEFRILNERTTELESNMKQEMDEEKKREMERELNKVITEKEELEKRLTRVRNKRKEEKREMEEMERRLTRVRNKRKGEKREMEEMEEMDKWLTSHLDSKGEDREMEGLLETHTLSRLNRTGEDRERRCVTCCRIY